MTLSIPSYISAIKPYVPGKPAEELEREYGIGNAAKLASNENPIGPSPLAIQAIERCLATLHRYPDGGGYHLVNGLAAHIGVGADHIILGNGSDEIIAMLSRVMLRPGDQVIIPTPSFLMYEIAAQSAGAEVVPVPLTSLSIDLGGILSAIGPNTRMIFICNPNNPTGSMITHGQFAEFMSCVPEHVLVVVDEAYVDFVRHPDKLSSLAFLDRHPSVVVLRTFSKAYGLAGLRIGYGITSPELVGYLHRIRLPFNASVPAQVGALAALQDQAFLKRTIAIVHEELDRMFTSLGRMHIRCFPTQANFFLVDINQDATEIYSRMLRHGVIVRAMAAYGYPNYLRVSVGSPADNQRFIEVLGGVLS